MPRAPRGPGQPRPHSRSSSATRLATNLQFTQKEPQLPKHTDKAKKAPYEPKPAPPFARVNSTQRVHSREHLAKRLAPQPPQPRPKNAKGFTIASPSENADDDDDEDEDDWVSSESGAATPNHQDSDSETASEEDDPSPALLNLQIPPPPPQARAPPPHPTHQVGFLAKNESSLARVDTARPSDFEHLPRIERSTPRPPTPPKQYHQPQVQPPPPPPQPQHSLMERRSTENIRELPIHARQSPRPKRNSRPPSTHSIQGRNEHPLRPHPLIRGMSHGHVIPVPKPSPLAPLTVLPVEGDLPQVSSSPSSVHDSVKNYLSSSPTSLKTSSGSPVSTDLSHSARYPSSQDRRTSFSSARSVNTIPVQTTITPWTHDRTRTLSTMSSSSLSAALSSLTHIPSVTRPPSPQSIVFFPPVNPHANVEAIHPLLPVPYLQNHLTVLSRRTPIRESFDRVMHAKNTR